MRRPAHRNKGSSIWKALPAKGRMQRRVAPRRTTTERTALVGSCFSRGEEGSCPPQPWFFCLPPEIVCRPLKNADGMPPPDPDKPLVAVWGFAAEAGQHGRHGNLLPPGIRNSDTDRNESHRYRSFDLREGRVGTPMGCHRKAQDGKHWVIGRRRSKRGKGGTICGAVEAERRASARWPGRRRGDIFQEIEPMHRRLLFHKTFPIDYKRMASNLGQAQ
jgi:hypothetical protein